MPKFEMSQETGTIARWLKQNGEAIAKGDAILEVETDKVTMEVESPASGTLNGIAAQPGEVIPIGQVIAFVWAARGGPPKPSEGGRATPVAEKMAAEHGIALADIRGSGKIGQITKGDVEAQLTQRAAVAPDSVRRRSRGARRAPAGARA